MFHSLTLFHPPTPELSFQILMRVLLFGNVKFPFQQQTYIWHRFKAYFIICLDNTTKFQKDITKGHYKSRFFIPSTPKLGPRNRSNNNNDFFISLTDHFPPLLQGAPPLSVPHELLVSEGEVYRSLSSLQVSKAVGPDNIPNKLLKDFAQELAPVIRDIYNQSLREGYIPSLLKSSIATPITKVTPPRTIESDLRPISLTCTVAKVMEGFTCCRLLPQLDDKIDPRQYARKEHSTTDALLYMLQAIYEAVDSGEAGARISSSPISPKASTSSITSF